MVRRVSDVTGFSLINENVPDESRYDRTKDGRRHYGQKVLNYGIGGHIVPHYDAFTVCSKRDVFLEFKFVFLFFISIEK